MMYENEYLSEIPCITSPNQMKKHHKKLHFSHQNIPSENKRATMDQDSFRKHLEDFTSYNLDNLPSKVNFLNAPNQ